MSALGRTKVTRAVQTGLLVGGLAAFIATGGCAHRIAISPTIQPNAFISEEFPRTVAVVFASEMKTYVEHARPSSWTGSAHTYDFEMGEQLCGALFRAVQIAYADVFEPVSAPQRGDYDRIIKFSLQNSNIDVYFQDGFLTTSGRATYSVSVGIEAYEGTSMALLRKSTVTGNGFTARGNTDGFTADKQFVLAVEAGVQELADNVANLLISGFAEPETEASP